MTKTLFKNKGKIICYIKHYEDKHVVCTGKPSDPSCISWTYDNKEAAEFTAKEYFDNRVNMFK